jgi:sulfur-carrier protein
MSEEERVVVTLRLPSTLSSYSGGKSQIAIEANTVEQMLATLAQQYPQVWQYLCTAEGYVRRNVQIFVNNELITGESGLKTELLSGQEVIVLPTTFNMEN